jgi:hypothetical protein
MADDPNTMSLSRRAALTGALTALSTVPAIAATFPNDDREEWLALYRTFCEAERNFMERSDTVAESLDDIWATPEADAYRAAENALIDKPADSMIGIAVKLVLWVHLDGEPPGLDQTMEDADNQIAVSAWRDALWLAGLPEGLGTRAYRESMLLAGGSNG